MKRIAVIVKNTTFSRYFGGLETHTKLLIDRLSDNGFDIEVFSPKRDLKNEFISDGKKKYFFVDCKYKTGPLSFIFKNSWYQKLLNIFTIKNNENPYDLIISISSAGYPLIENKKNFNINILTVSHGSAYSEYKSLLNEGFSFGVLMNFPYFLYNYLFKQKNFINKSDFIICVSNYVRESLISETGVDEKKVLVIHNGSRIEQYSKDFHEQGVLKVLFAGRVEKSKGILVLIKSIKDLDVELIVAGDGSLMSEVKKLTKDLRLESKVRFTGKLDYQELIKEYKSSDLLVAPSLRLEGFPMSIVEGMGYFLPVIATKIGGNSDAVYEGRNGFLIEPNDESELRERIKFFNTYPEKIKQFGMNSRNLAEQKFNLDIMIDLYIKKIEEMFK